MADTDPQVEYGFVMIASELFAALALGGFSRAEWIVLHEVLSPMYGRKKCKSAYVNCHRAAVAYGYDRRHITRALTALTAGKVVIHVGRGEYRFNKAYKQWLGANGEPRLGGVALAFCQAVRLGGEGPDSPPKNGGQIRPQQGPDSPLLCTDVWGPDSPPKSPQQGPDSPLNFVPPHTPPLKRDPEYTPVSSPACAPAIAREGDRPATCRDLGDQVCRMLGEVCSDGSVDGLSAVPISAAIRSWWDHHPDTPPGDLAVVVLEAASKTARKPATRFGGRVSLFGAILRGSLQPCVAVAPPVGESPPGGGNGTTGTPGALPAVPYESPSKRAYREQLAKFQAAADREAAENAAAAAHAKGVSSA